MDERGSYKLYKGNLLRSTFGVRNAKVYLNGLPLTGAKRAMPILMPYRPPLLKNCRIMGGAWWRYGAGTGGDVTMNNDNTQQKKTRQHR
jgi:hypothetical protein